MRKAILIFGTLLITITILISGSVVAPWVTVYNWGDCTNIYSIENAPNGSYASIGINATMIDPPKLGWVELDLGAGNAMGPSQQFTVWAESPVREMYAVLVAVTPEDDAWFLGFGNDTLNTIFTTPPNLGYSWRYIIIIGMTGVPMPSGGDIAYGPDIDAVGWY